MFFLRLLLFVLLFFVSASAHNIIITGNKTIESNTIRTYSNLDTKPSITDKDLSQAIKDIYATGFFNNITISQNDDSITINVAETPVIKKIAFNGSKAIGKDKLLEELITKEKRFFSKTDIQNDTKRLTLIYQKIGFLKVNIHPMAELSEDGSQVTVIFDINEGHKTQIEKISIIGNKYFSDSTIKDDALKIKQRRFFTFNTRASFDAEQVQNEIENIKRFYFIHGFPKFVHKNTVSKYNPKTNRFAITYFIEEGEKYKFGTYKIRSFIEDFDVSLIKPKIIYHKKNTVFNIEHIEKTITNIQEILQERGFMFSQVEYNLNLTDDKKANIEYTIKNSQRIYLHKIDIIGNIKTSDNIIRREFLLKEGDVYNVVKLRRSIQRLRNLQYFDDIQIDEKLIQDTTDRMILTITVKERSTADINASLGYDQINGIGGNIGIRELNFLGEGYSAGFSVERTLVSEGYRVSFTEPYVKGKNILLGINLSYSKYGNPAFVAYNSGTQSIGLTAAYSITEYLRHSLIYRYQIDNITKNTSSISPFILAQIGNYQTSAIASTLYYDKRDNNFIPNEGYSLMLRNEIAGFGGNVKFISSEIRGDWYQKLFNIDDLIFSTKVRAATITSIGNSVVNIQNLYSLGGGFGMRGFNYRGIGPRLATLDKNDNILTYESFSYGGKNLRMASFELRFPNKLPKDIGLITYLFLDVGTLYGIDGYNLKTTTTTIIDSKSFRTSTGLGISWRSPMGPIGFAFGKTLRQEVYDNSLFFLITFGGTGQM